jgi:DNA-binding MarR family transcriptional regulator
MDKSPPEFYKPAPPLRDLQFLEALEQNPHLTQRELSHRLGIALGVTNACLKNMARKGWIKIKKIPPRRIGYYLTPHGFAEKSKLTYRLLSNTVRQYAAAKRNIARKLLAWEKAGIKRIVFYGVSEEMEIAYITLQGVNLELVGIVDDDPAKQKVRFFGIEIQAPDQLIQYQPDGVLITSVQAKERIEKHLKNHFSQLDLKVESL